MLILARKEGQKIHIGDEITITVTQIERGKVRIGIEAPMYFKIYRDELKPGNTTPGADESQ